MAALADTTRVPWRALVASVAVLALGAGLIFGVHSFRRARALRQQAEKTNAQFAPVLERLETTSQAVKPAVLSPPSSGRGAPEAPAPQQVASFDLDKTIRVIHEIDQAVRRAPSLDEYLAQMAQRDYAGVAPEVLRAHKAILSSLAKIHSRQLDAKGQHEAWLFTGEILFTLLSTVEGGALTQAMSFKVDRAQAKRNLEALKDKQAKYAEILEDIREMEENLLDTMLEYSEVHYRYIREWDALCNHRDRAYLAAVNGNWAAALAASEQAIAMAPNEREAHVLKALAHIETFRAARGTGEANGSLVAGLKGDSADVMAQLTAFIAAHPEASAPAYLLRGAWNDAQGNHDEAKLDFDQAAVYYPRQAEQLLDMAHPYRARSFLRKSNEGNYILELYKSTMLGAGYFSPDLQLARMHLERGNITEWRSKVLDHFSRRRQQRQWDFVLSDIAFCERSFGEAFRSVLPEDAYLDLISKETMIGEKLSIALKNRSERELHNATLVLAAHFTDMHRQDYEPIVAGPTQALVRPLDTTSFGDVPIEFTLFGQPKGVKDISTLRAVLVADEGVAWVDTGEQKREAALRAVPRPAAASGEQDAAVAAIHKQATLKIERSSLPLVPDDIVLTLPRVVALLKPVFRLHIEEKMLAPDENVLMEDGVHLRWKRAGNLSTGARPGLFLLIDSAVRPIQMAWAPSEQGYHLEATK